MIARYLRIFPPIVTALAMMTPVSHQRTVSIRSETVYKQSLICAEHPFCYNPSYLVGAWRSLVARFNGVEEVVSSNLAAPTKKTPFDTAFFY